mmetsp:Transcript_41740/g.110258  ORF Transcript_41740/g.110258 Transcript_41740/m.110258 type:complete len:348 (-) Transcript_41740:352-1395(-)
MTYHFSSASHTSMVPRKSPWPVKYFFTRRLSMSSKSMCGRFEDGSMGLLPPSSPLPPSSSTSSPPSASSATSMAAGAAGAASAVEASVVRFSHGAVATRESVKLGAETRTGGAMESCGALCRTPHSPIPAASEASSRNLSNLPPMGRLAGKVLPKARSSEALTAAFNAFLRSVGDALAALAAAMAALPSPSATSSRQDCGFTSMHSRELERTSILIAVRSAKLVSTPCKAFGFTLYPSMNTRSGGGARSGRRRACSSMHRSLSSSIDLTSITPTSTETSAPSFTWRMAQPQERAGSRLRTRVAPSTGTTNSGVSSSSTAAELEATADFVAPAWAKRVANSGSRRRCR